MTGFIFVLDYNLVVLKENSLSQECTDYFVKIWQLEIPLESFEDHSLHFNKLIESEGALHQGAYILYDWVLNLQVFSSHKECHTCNKSGNLF
jgi:hypothetical protein